MAKSYVVGVSSLLVFCLALPCLATVYTVGDTTGWTTGEDYTTWTAGKTFVVGDSLVFNYGGAHTADEVRESDYKTCTTGNSITTDNSGSTTVTLTTARTHYFMCGVAGHCGRGMKLSVAVGSGSGSGSPPSITTPTSTDSNGSPSRSSLSGLVAILLVGWYALRVVF